MSKLLESGCESVVLTLLPKLLSAEVSVERVENRLTEIMP